VARASRKLGGRRVTVTLRPRHTAARRGRYRLVVSLGAQGAETVSVRLT
jgi:hypothetical protein